MSEIKVGFMESGIDVHIIKYDSNAIKESLAPAIYNIKLPPMGGPYLQINASGIQIPEKVYGNVNSKIHTVMNTYDNDPKSLGVLLTGIKGSGKTMTAGMLCKEMLARNIPVILVNSSIPVDALNQIIESVGEVCILFDEFGKMYDEDDQSRMLTIFSGVSSQKRMIVITENSISKINSFMLNRPSRLLYHFRHANLESEIITEYCEELAVKKEFHDEVVIYSKTVCSFTFDILQAIVKQHLLNPEVKFKDLISIMNVQHPFVNERKNCELISLKSAETNEQIKIANAKGLNYDRFWRDFSVVFDKNTRIGQEMYNYFKEEDEEFLEDNEEISIPYRLHISNSHIVKYDQEKNEYHVLTKVGEHEFIAVIKESIGEIFNSYHLV